MNPQGREYASQPVRHEQTRLEPPKPSDDPLSRSAVARLLKFLPRPLFRTASTLLSRILQMLSLLFLASFGATTLY